MIDPHGLLYGSMHEFSEIPGQKYLLAQNASRWYEIYLLAEAEKQLKIYWPKARRPLPVFPAAQKYSSWVWLAAH